MADPEADAVRLADLGANAAAGGPRDPSLYLPDSGPEDLLRGPLVLVAISRVLSVPFYLFCAVETSKDWRRSPPYPANPSSLFVADRLLLIGSLWVFTLLSVLLAWLFFSRRRAFRPLMSLFCCLYLLLLTGVYLHYRHFAPLYGFTPTLGLGSGWVENGLYLFVLSSFFWPFYYAFSSRAKRVFIR